MDFLRANFDALFFISVITYILAFFISISKNKFLKKYKFLTIFFSILSAIIVFYFYINLSINYDEINKLENIKNGQIYKDNENLRQLFQISLVDNKITKNEYNHIIKLELNIMSDNLENYFNNKIQEMKKD